VICVNHHTGPTSPTDASESTGEGGGDVVVGVDGETVVAADGDGVLVDSTAGGSV
jgi:hypothetical protein